MPRAIVLALAFALFGAPAFAQTPMKPTAPQKMTSPEEQKKMHACEKCALDHGLHDEEVGAVKE